MAHKRTCLVLLLVLATNCLPAGLAQNLFDNSYPMMVQPQPNQPQFQRRPTPLPPKASRLEEIMPRRDFPVAFLQPLSLAGVKIPGLNKKSVQMLGQNFFVVVDNTKFSTMSEIYKENRQRGKSNFVTADCIVHPYFAFTNRVIADVITEHIAPDLEAMLKAMLVRALADYKLAEDAEVRNDIEHNIAFLSVAVKLIDPKFFPSIPLRAVPMVRDDLDSIYSGHGARSAIFDRVVDFSAYQPLGWYNSTPRLANFYRCREWVTQMSYPFSDVAFGTQGKMGNYFRRSALLYRALDLSQIDGKPAYQTWERIYKAWPLLGAQLKDWQESTISPLEYKAQVKTASADLKVTLNALSEPLFRTKLLLSVRKQKPLKLSATSIMDLNSSTRASSEAPVSFRLLPVTGDPEWPWLKSCAALKEERNDSGSSWPFALLIMHSWGAPQANNTLLDNFMRLDPPTIMKVLPDLDQMVMTKLPGGIVKPLEDRRWKILSPYFKPNPESAQSAVRTEAWMTHLLESAFAGWVDSHLAIAGEPQSAGSAAGKPAGGNLASDKGGGSAASNAQQGAEQQAPNDNPLRRTKVCLFHCVQPTPDVFQMVSDDAHDLQERLSSLGYLPDRFKDRFADFVRLATRLQKMAELELKGQSLPMSDIKLLQNIDVVLEQVESPTEGVLPLISPNASLPTAAARAAESGVNFGLGRPGQLFIILQDGSNWTLGRGAVYTYFEVPGPPISAEHWRRKLDNDLLSPNFWEEKYDIAQQIVAGETRMTGSRH
jgi:hypothetical protein